MAPKSLAEPLPWEQPRAAIGKTITWDHGSLTLIRERANYGRVIALRDGRLLAAYASRGVIEIAYSDDAGERWGGHRAVARYAHGNAANAEVVQLRDGTLLLGYNERPEQPGHPHTIMVTRSDDAGQTWSEPDRVYAAGNDRRRGCWEPAFVELPDGEAHLYFANEFPYADTKEQEITLLRSADGGQTWSGGERVSFSPGSRDGMPVPLLTQDRKTLLLAIEDNGPRERFEPAIVRTPANASWRDGGVGPDSPDRVRPFNLHPAGAYGGAPYLAQTPNNEIILAFQLNPTPQGKATDRAFAVAAVGDPETLTFGPLSAPLEPFGNPTSLWSSVFTHDDGTIMLVTSTRIDGVQGLYTLKGRVVQAP